MKKRILLMLLLSGAAGKGLIGAEPVTLSFYLGTVQVRTGAAGEWQAAAFGQGLKTGDQIKTFEESRAELKIGSGGVTRIGENSLYTIKEASVTAESITCSGELSIGKVWSNVKKLAKTKSQFKVHSPTAIAAIRGTIYNLESDADSTATVKVYDGEVEVKPPSPPPSKPQPPTFRRPGEVGGPQRIAPPRRVSMAQWVEVIKAQQQIVIRRDGSKKVSEFDLAEDEKDDWVKWNKDEDKKLEKK